ncbi:MAG: L,D-transpeptidase family protein [Alphaproteobacteria bacterium]|nr:L,D-transpeptidase family protein [Alphaproteobacteria bacterium]
MRLVVHAPDRLTAGSRSFRCTIGRNGVRDDKAEGDGATPAGQFALHRVIYRADRLSRPDTGLPAAALAEDLGWCDDANEPLYNQPVQLPFAGSHEVLWREDSVYDVIVVLGHNDSPPVPGKGSAIFMHVAQPDYGPTDGCIALALADLLEVLALCGPGDTIEINPGGAADAHRK